MVATAKTALSDGLDSDESFTAREETIEGAYVI